MSQTLRLSDIQPCSSQPEHCRTFQPACLSSPASSTWRPLAAAGPATGSVLQQSSQALQTPSHCSSSPPSPTGSAAALPGSAAGLSLQQQSSHCRSSPPTAAAVLPVLQVLQPSQVLQQASHCNSSPPTATAVFPLQQQSSHCSSSAPSPSPTGSAAALPGSAAGLPLQQQSSHCSSSPSSPTGSAATLPGFLAVLPAARPLTVDRGVQLPRPCDLDGRARSATGGEGTCSRYHFSPSSQPEKTN